jgi:hypothetical protein
MSEIELNEIIEDLNQQIQSLEDLKTHLAEMQEETQGMIAGVKMWFEQDRNKTTEGDNNGTN